MKKITLLLLLLLSVNLVIAKKYKFVPKNHSNQWINGVEWATAQMGEITVKALFQKDRRGNFLFKIQVINSSGHNININPDSSYFRINNLNEDITLKKKYKSKYSIPIESDDQYIEYLKKVYSSASFDPIGEMRKKAKLFIKPGYLYDSDNVAIARGRSNRKKYYKKIIFSKNTIKSNTQLDQGVIIDKIDEANDLSLVLYVNNERFILPFTRVN